MTQSERYTVEGCYRAARREEAFGNIERDALLEINAARQGLLKDLKAIQEKMEYLDSEQLRRITRMVEYGKEAVKWTKRGERIKKREDRLARKENRRNGRTRPWWYKG